MALVMLNYLLALTAIGIALALGGKPERLGAAMITIMTLVTFFGNLLLQKHYKTVDRLSLGEDILGFLGFGAIGICSKRVWPLWASSLQLLSVGAHFVRALELPVRPIVYAWMKSGPTWVVLILLICGTIANRDRRPLRDNVSSSPT